MMAQTYALLRDDGSLLYARSSASGIEILDAKPNVAAVDITVFVLGTDVLSLTAKINARNEAEARRAAPYAVEDEVGEAVEELHIALGAKPLDAGQPRRILVTAKTYMERVIAALDAQGLNDAALIAAHDVIPHDNRLVLVRDIVLGRIGQRSFAMEVGVGADVFGGLIRDHADVSIYGEALASDLSVRAAGDGLDSDNALLETLIGWHMAGPSIDLRQGVYEVRRAANVGDVKRWRLVGALAAAGLAGWFAVNIFQTNAMQARTETLNTRIAEFTAAGWPEANGNAVQAEAMARAARGRVDTRFPIALDAVAGLYDALDAVDASELRSLRYDRARGVLSAVVAYNTFADGDALVSAMSKGGLNVRLGDARQSGTKVVSEITLEAAQ